MSAAGFRVGIGLNHPIDGLILRAENVTIDYMNSNATPPHATPALIQPTSHRVSVRLLIVIGAVFLILAITLGVLATQFNWLSRVAPSVANLSDVGPQSLIMHDMPICVPTVAGVGTNASANQSPFGLAWFHKPPQDGTTAEQLAAQSSYIHFTGAADIPFRDELRSAGYKGRILTYTGMNSIEGPGPYADGSQPCDANYTPHDNQLAFFKGDFCAYINGHESWFLHNGAGQRLVDDYFGSGRITYMMNPADPGWRAFAMQRLTYIKDVWFYDGVWLDNVDLDLTRMTSELKNSDGKVREYSTDAAWKQASAGWLADARKTLGDNYPIWGNLVGGGLRADAWDAYAPYLDGAMDESFAVKWLDGWRSTEQWQAQIQRAGRWLAAGKGLVMVGQGAQDDTDRMRFSLASYLLVAQGDGAQSTFRYTRYDTYYEQMWLYPEYDTARQLGAPTGTCSEVSPGLWRRDFQRGYVQVDLSTHQGSLVLRP